MNLKLEIGDERTIGELKKEFSAQFPFLRLTFFSATKGNTNLNPLQQIVDETKQLKSLRKLHNEGELVFSGEDKVGTIEKKLLEKFGLAVQIFRRSGDNWLLTSSTDDYTLNRQNALGKEMSEHVPSPEPEDIHEHE